MSSGQTALSISDIPFMYSFVNLIFIWQTGITGFESLPIIGLIAGVIGTFLVFWHPIQWVIDELMMRNMGNYSVYTIENHGHVPSKYDLQLEGWFSLSLKTSAIKYLKDKISSQVYFIVILTTFVLLLIDPNFQKTLKLENTVYPILIQIGLIIMLIALVYLYKKNSNQFIQNVKITSLYFLISNDVIGYRDQSLVIKEAIDLNDWDTANNVIDKTLRSMWGNFPHI